MNRNRFHRICAAAARSAAASIATVLAVSATAMSAPTMDNDYPTVAIADYVFGCMASNGQTRQALEKCSCSVDIIASLLTYDQFVEAETVMRMRMMGGEKSAIFRSGVEPKAAYARLKRAQAEAEIRCF